MKNKAVRALLADGNFEKLASQAVDIFGKVILIDGFLRDAFWYGARLTNSKNLSGRNDTIMAALISPDVKS
jgi:hypothetical protein